MSQQIKPETRVFHLNFERAWSNLTEKERNYAYFLSKASWAGAKMCFHQCSYEAPPLFLIFQAYFSEKDFLVLEQNAAAAGVTNEEWVKFTAYVAGFYGNLCNYHSFGAAKFAPELSPQKFRAIIFSHPCFAKKSMYSKSKVQETIEQIYPMVETEIFALQKPYTQINHPAEGGVTGYFGRNMTKEDLALIQDCLKQEKIDILNTRAFKEQDGSFLITVGSIDTSASRNVECKGNKFRIQYGEFAPYLKECNFYLKEAMKYAANQNQVDMVQKYIEHYENGSIETHKDSQRKWIADKGPVVESNMGWIETYLDPENMRAYFEGWVAVVDKVKSQKFQNLVTKSEVIIPMLPWPKEMEKENFLAPDFTMLEVISFATTGTPLGINIPNYDDIRDNEGFKNVFLGNSMATYGGKTQVEFATEEQGKILSENVINCYEVHVACHELLGHGCGKLIFRNKDGSVPTFTDPVTKEEFQSCYEEGDTWNEKFGAISTSYEECRADACGFYLCTFPEVYEIFGFEEKDISTLLWVNLQQQLRKGLLGLQLFNAETKKWGQAHTQGAYVLTQYLLQNQKTDIVRIEFTENDTSFIIHLNQENLMAEGREMLKEFLIIIQTYKSSGCVERGQKFYDHYSKVEGDFLKMRELVIKNKKPRRVELQTNLMRYNEKTISPVNYPECFEGLIHSFADRFPFNSELVDQIMGEWMPTKDHLRVVQ